VDSTAVATPTRGYRLMLEVDDQCFGTGTGWSETCSKNAIQQDEALARLLDLVVDYFKFVNVLN
jgi:hypothetical protein